jgi:cytoskeletal protein CcmA (bactofilin family)
MWNKRREEDLKPRPVAPPTSAELAKEGIPISTFATKNSETDIPRSNALIGKSVLIKGQIYSREDLTIDGEVDGTIELQEHRLTIGPHGKVQAGIRARDVVIMGTVHGNIEAADKIDIRKEAKLVGDIKTARIVIEDGAYFKGSIDISRPEATKAQVPKPQAAAAPASPAPQQQPLVSRPVEAK